MVRSCISKIHNKFADNAEDLDIVIFMWKLFYENKKFVGFYRDEVNHSAN